MIELNIWQLLVGFVAAMGIPSAVMGLIVRQLEKRLARRDSLRDEQDRSQKDLIVLLVQSTNASIGSARRRRGRCSASRMRTATGICTRHWNMPPASSTSRRTF